MISFAVEQVENESTGDKIAALVKTTVVEGKPVEKETWTSIAELDRLFGACSARWGTNWNVEKVIAAVEDTEIE